MEKNRVRALISLLDDPNEEIFTTVECELLKEDVEIVSELETVWENTVDAAYQKRIENLIHALQFRDLKSRLRDWHRSNHEDLLQGAYLVAKYQYPELKLESIESKIHEVQTEIWLELNNSLTALEKVRVMNHFLFNVHGFTRNNSNFISAKNSFINDVLETRQGNPVSLSVIYSVIALRLGIPVYGVNLPKNFILAYLDDTGELSSATKEHEPPVLFYINPVNKGAVLGRGEIDLFLQQQKIEPADSYFLPCNNRQIVIRMLNNILYSYENSSLNGKVNEIKELLSIFNDDAKV